MRPRFLPLALVAALLPALAHGQTAPSSRSCAPDNGGITLPKGFCATVFADSLANPRHITVAPNGDVFVAINSPSNNQPDFGIIGLRDNDGDGRSDQQSTFSAGLTVFP